MRALSAITTKLFDELDESARADRACLSNEEGQEGARHRTRPSTRLALSLCSPSLTTTIQRRPLSHAHDCPGRHRRLPFGLSDCSIFVKHYTSSCIRPPSSGASGTPVDVDVHSICFLARCG